MYISLLRTCGWIETWPNSSLFLYKQNFQIKRRWWRWSGCCEWAKLRWHWERHQGTLVLCFDLLLNLLNLHNVRLPQKGYECNITHVISMRWLNWQVAPLVRSGCLAYGWREGWAHVRPVIHHLEPFVEHVSTAVCGLHFVGHGVCQSHLCHLCWVVRCLCCPISECWPKTMYCHVVASHPA